MKANNIVALALVLDLVLAAITAPASWSKSKVAAVEKLQAQATASNAVPCLSWVNPVIPARGALLCIHGLGLYSGAYDSFGHHMSQIGIRSYAIDVRGFGSWMKANGHEEVDFKGCLDDVRAALKAIRAANPGLPVFVLGESMGGAIALRAAAMYPDLIDGLISSVPASERFKQRKTDLKVAVELLKGPHHEFDIGDKIVSQATANPALKRDWEDNPLDRMDLSPKELIQFQKFMNENHDIAPQIGKMPVLMVQGTKDKLVKPEGTWELFNEIASEQKTFFAVPSEHLIFENQQDQENKFDRVTDQLLSSWITANLPDDSNAPALVRNLPLERAVNELNNGHYIMAQQNLLGLLKAAPNSGEVHYWLGATLFKMGKPLEARAQFTAAINCPNTTSAASASNYFVAISDLKGSSNVGGSTVNSTGSGGSTVSGSSTQTANGTKSGNASTHGAVGADDALTAKQAASKLANGAPTVVAFMAPWAQPCNNIDTLFKQARNAFGQKIQMQKLDVEDPSNKAAINALGIGPVPTFLFLTAAGDVSSASVGSTTYLDFAKGVLNTLRSTASAH